MAEIYSAENPPPLRRAGESVESYRRRCGWHVPSAEKDGAFEQAWRLRPIHPDRPTDKDLAHYWWRAGASGPAEKLLESQAAGGAQENGARDFPELKPELASILGTMCFQCITIAQALRAAGHQIKTQAEDEQAAVLHWMLGHYFREGEDGWRKAAADDLKRMQTAALAAKDGAA